MFSTVSNYTAAAAAAGVISHVTDLPSVLHGARALVSRSMRHSRAGLLTWQTADVVPVTSLIQRHQRALDTRHWLTNGSRPGPTDWPRPRLLQGVSRRTTAGFAFTW